MYSNVRKFVEHRIERMSLREKIGQMMLVGFRGQSINSEILTLLREYHVGGFVLFKENIASVEQLYELVNSLKKSNYVNKEPIFVSIDEEGGRVSRMPEELTKLPPCREVGKVNSRSFSKDIGSLMAEKLRSFGINMNFAPVLDVESVTNVVIGDRSFGRDASLVADLGTEMMKGIKEGGVIAVAKHFIGHGGTEVDSHISLPKIATEFSVIEKRDLIPFKKAIEEGADCVMTAHILFSSIDGSFPVTMSKKAIGGLLREKLKYSGVVITDDMTMGAILCNYNIGEASVRAVLSGADIILAAHGIEKQVEIFNAVENAVNIGMIPLDRINEAVNRILTLKLKYNISDVITSLTDIIKINMRIETTIERYIN